MMKTVITSCIIELKSIHYFKCASQIPLSLSGQNLAHTFQTATTCSKH